MDTQDIINTLKGAAKMLQSAKFESFNTTTNTKATGNSKKAGSVPRDLNRNQQAPDVTLASIVASGDSEAAELIKFVEDVSSVSVDKFLQLNRLQYRVYQSEDSSLLTSVYFNHNRDRLCSTLIKMASALSKFVQDKFSGK